jgi:hypothetical protein
MLLFFVALITAGTLVATALASIIATRLARRACRVFNERVEQRESAWVLGKGLQIESVKLGITSVSLSVLTDFLTSGFKLPIIHLKVRGLSFNARISPGTSDILDEDCTVQLLDALAFDDEGGCPVGAAFSFLSSFSPDHPLWPAFKRAWNILRLMRGVINMLGASSADMAFLLRLSGGGIIRGELGCISIRTPTDDRCLRLQVDVESPEGGRVLSSGVGSGVYMNGSCALKVEMCGPFETMAADDDMLMKKDQLNTCRPFLVPKCVKLSLPRINIITRGKDLLAVSKWIRVLQTIGREGGFRLPSSQQLVCSTPKASAQRWQSSLYLREFWCSTRHISSILAWIDISCTLESIRVEVASTVGTVPPDAGAGFTLALNTLHLSLRGADEDFCQSDLRLTCSLGSLLALSRRIVAEDAFPGGGGQMLLQCGNSSLQTECRYKVGNQHLLSSLHPDLRLIGRVASPKVTLCRENLDGLTGFVPLLQQLAMSSPQMQMHSSPSPLQAQAAERALDTDEVQPCPFQLCEVSLSLDVEGLECTMSDAASGGSASLLFAVPDTRINWSKGRHSVQPLLLSFSEIESSYELENVVPDRKIMLAWLRIASVDVTLKVCHGEQEDDGEDDDTKRNVAIEVAKTWVEATPGLGFVFSRLIDMGLEFAVQGRLLSGYSGSDYSPLNLHHSLASTCKAWPPTKLGDPHHLAASFTNRLSALCAGERSMAGFLFLHVSSVVVEMPYNCQFDLGAYGTGDIAGWFSAFEDGELRTRDWACQVVCVEHFRVGAPLDPLSNIEVNVAITGVAVESTGYDALGRVMSLPTAPLYLKGSGEDFVLRRSAPANPYLTVARFALCKRKGYPEVVDIIADGVHGSWSPDTHISIIKCSQDVTLGVWMCLLAGRKALARAGGGREDKNPPWNSGAALRYWVAHWTHACATRQVSPSGDGIIRLHVTQVDIEANFDNRVLDGVPLTAHVSVASFESESAPEHFRFTGAVVSLQKKPVVAVCVLSLSSTLRSQTESVAKGHLDRPPGWMVGNTFHEIKARSQCPGADAILVAAIPAEIRAMIEEKQGFEIATNGVSLIAPHELHLGGALEAVSSSVSDLLAALRKKKGRWHPPTEVADFRRLFWMPPKPVEQYKASGSLDKANQMWGTHVWLRAQELSMEVEDDPMESWLDGISSLWLLTLAERATREQLRGFGPDASVLPLEVGDKDFASDYIRRSRVVRMQTRPSSLMKVAVNQLAVDATPHLTGPAHCSKMISRLDESPASAPPCDCTVRASAGVVLSGLSVGLRKCPTPMLSVARVSLESDATLIFGDLPKIFSELSLHVESPRFTYSPALEFALEDLSRCTQMFYPPSLYMDAGLEWWDVMRLLVHGTADVNIVDAEVVLSSAIRTCSAKSCSPSISFVGGLGAQLSSPELALKGAYSQAAVLKGDDELIIDMKLARLRSSSSLISLDCAGVTISLPPPLIADNGSTVRCSAESQASCFFALPPLLEIPTIRSSISLNWQSAGDSAMHWVKFSTYPSDPFSDYRSLGLTLEVKAEIFGLNGYRQAAATAAESNTDSSVPYLDLNSESVRGWGLSDDMKVTIFGASLGRLWNWGLRYSVLPPFPIPRKKGSVKGSGLQGLKAHMKGLVLHPVDVSGADIAVFDTSSHDPYRRGLRVSITDKTSLSITILETAGQSLPDPFLTGKVAIPGQSRCIWAISDLCLSVSAVNVTVLDHESGPHGALLLAVSRVGLRQKGCDEPLQQEEGKVAFPAIPQLPEAFAPVPPEGALGRAHSVGPKLKPLSRRKAEQPGHLSERHLGMRDTSSPDRAAAGPLVESLPPEIDSKDNTDIWLSSKAGRVALTRRKTQMKDAPGGDFAPADCGTPNATHGGEDNSLLHFQTPGIVLEDPTEFSSGEASVGFLYQVAIDRPHIVVTPQLRDSLALLVQSLLDVLYSSISQLSRPSKLLLHDSVCNREDPSSPHSRKGVLPLRQWGQPLVIPLKLAGTEVPTESGKGSEALQQLFTIDVRLLQLQLRDDGSKSCMAYGMEQATVQGWVGLGQDWPAECVQSNLHMQCLAQRLLPNFRETVTMTVAGAIVCVAPTDVDVGAGILWLPDTAFLSIPASNGMFGDSDGGPANFGAPILSPASSALANERQQMILQASKRRSKDYSCLSPAEPAFGMFRPIVERMGEIQLQVQSYHGLAESIMLLISVPFASVLMDDVQLHWLSGVSSSFLAAPVPEAVRQQWQSDFRRKKQVVSERRGGSSELLDILQPCAVQQAWDELRQVRWRLQELARLQAELTVTLAALNVSNQVSHVVLTPLQRWMANAETEAEAMRVEEESCSVWMRYIQKEHRKRIAVKPNTVLEMEMDGFDVKLLHNKGKVAFLRTVISSVDVGFISYDDASGSLDVAVACVRVEQPRIRSRALALSPTKRKISLGSSSTSLFSGTTDEDVITSVSTIVAPLMPKDLEHVRISGTTRHTIRGWTPKDTDIRIHAVIGSPTGSVPHLLHFEVSVFPQVVRLNRPILTDLSQFLQGSEAASRSVTSDAKGKLDFLASRSVSSGPSEKLAVGWKRGLRSIKKRRASRLNGSSKSVADSDYEVDEDDDENDDGQMLKSLTMTPPRSEMTMSPVREAREPLALLSVHDDEPTLPVFLRPICMRHVRIGEINIFLSYAGGQESDLEDVDNFHVKLHPLVYNNKLWTLRKMFSRMRRGVIMDLLGQVSRNFNNIGLFLGNIFGIRAKAGTGTASAPYNAPAASEDEGAEMPLSASEKGSPKVGGASLAQTQRRASSMSLTIDDGLSLSATGAESNVLASLFLSSDLNHDDEEHAGQRMDDKGNVSVESTSRGKHVLLPQSRSQTKKPSLSKVFGVFGHRKSSKSNMDVKAALVGNAAKSASHMRPHNI